MVPIIETPKAKRQNILKHLLLLDGLIGQRPISESYRQLNHAQLRAFTSCASLSELKSSAQLSRVCKQAVS